MIDWELVGTYTYFLIFGFVLVATFYGAIWTDQLIIKYLASAIFLLFMIFKSWDLFRYGESLK